MAWIKAMYKLPQIRHVIFIVDSLSTSSGNPKLSAKSMKRKETLERILHDKQSVLPKRDLQWTIKLIPEEDFLSSLESHKASLLGLSNPCVHSPEDMELLAINLLKTPSSPDRPSSTPKVLCKVPSEDIIEVFI